MSKVIEAKGSCLCGKVEVRASSISTDIGACHCDMCRKWAGGPYLGVDCNTEVEFSGAENVSAFSSSDWAERGFCSKCGTHLFYKLKEKGQYIMPVGLFEASSKFKFDHQIFIEEKPEYYDFANETKNMTGEEVFAMFAEQS